MTPKATATKNQMTLSMRDIAKIATILCVAASGIAWVHAEITIPQVLSRTADQLRIALDRHEAQTHKGALTQREFRLWAESWDKQLEKLAQQVNRRLDTIEAGLKEK